MAVGDGTGSMRWRALAGLRRATWLDIAGYVGLAYIGSLGVGGLAMMMSRH